MNRSTIVIIALSVVIALLLWFSGCNGKAFREEINLLKAANDTLVKKRNDDGSQTAKIALLQASNSGMLLRLDTKDATIRELQIEVRKNKNKIKDGGSVTVINSSTEYTATASTTVISNSPLNKDSSNCNPTYKSKNKDTTWVKWNIIAKRDSTYLDLKVNDKYTVVIGSEGKFLRKKPFVNVTNQNPYTDTKSIRAFEVKETRSKWTLSLQGGYGFTIHGLSPYLGLGVGFTILSL